ncbi:hypothetical protein [Novosphingobium guangzhouense]|uniref:Uncharacterized protein n=1 Tax=Novosphingobium guangzhouense TaxID=1850347 RepID=A0A2K2G553_9SPHN|nr:hypothetical protein [Novosphingobium guangzhouense]PNU06165.1 hypothetical protein A8V01_12480 [Novosphingobium guangzhouense]
MGKLAAQVMADRAARDDAKAKLDEHYHAFKADIDERGLAGRIADDALDQAKLMFDEAATMVEEHPAAIGGTLAALMLWFLRNPLIDLAQRLYAGVRNQVS